MKKSVLRKILSISLVSVMALTLFATTTAKTLAAAGVSKVVTITKTLNMADGITTPGTSFVFAFEKDVAHDAATPAIADKAAVYTNTDVKAQGDATLEKETGNIFAGVTFPHAGDFYYTITETAGAADIEKGKMEYDTSKYRMQVLVALDEDGNLYISNVNIAAIEDNGDLGAKVSSEPGEAITGSETFKLFTNTFTKNGGAGNETEAAEDAALKITHEVAGTAADTTKYFTYKVTLTESTTARAAIEYKGYVGSTEYSFITGTATTVTLKHGETINFETLPAGTRCTVELVGTTNYTPSYSYVSNSNTAVTNAAAKGAGLTASNVLVGERLNTITFTNTCNVEDIPPMGIDMNNLPFILIVLLSVGGFGLYVANKRRLRTR